MGIVGWMLSRLVSGYKMERARQAPEQRSSPLLVVVLAAAICGMATWLTDYRTAVSLALAAVAAAALIQRLRSRVLWLNVRSVDKTHEA